MGRKFLKYRPTGDYTCLRGPFNATHSFDNFLIGIIFNDAVSAASSRGKDTIK